MSISLESSLTLWHLECDVEIAIPIATTMSLTAHLHTHAVLDTSRDVDIFFYEGICVFFAITGAAFLDDRLASPTTVTTRALLLHDTKYRLHALAYTTSSATVTTLRRLASLAMTALTGHTALVLDLSSIATYSILE